MNTRSHFSGGGTPEPEAHGTPSTMEQKLLERIAQLEEGQASGANFLLQPSPQAIQLMGGQIGSLSGYAANFKQGMAGGAGPAAGRRAEGRRYGGGGPGQEVGRRPGRAVGRRPGRARP